MPRYDHSGGAVTAQLQSAMTTGGPVDISLDVSDGWPTTNFFVVIDRGLETEEKVRVASRSGLVLTVAERGADDTTPQSHALGAFVEHIFTALEADQANAHVEAQEAVHGLGVGDRVAGRAYADNAADGAEAAAKAYADVQDSAQSASDRAYTDAEAAAAQAAAEAHADSQDAAHLVAGDPHPQYLVEAEAQALVDSHANQDEGVHGLPVGQAPASQTDIDQTVIMVFDGDWLGQAHRIVAIKVEYPNPSSNFTLDISEYGFTDRPLAFITSKKNNASGAVQYVTLGQAPGSATELNMVAVDARDGTRPSTLPNPMYIDVLLVGKVS